MTTSRMVLMMVVGWGKRIVVVDGVGVFAWVVVVVAVDIIVLDQSNDSGSRRIEWGEYVEEEEVKKRYVAHICGLCISFSIAHPTISSLSHDTTYWCLPPRPSCARAGPTSPSHLEVRIGNITVVFSMANTCGNSHGYCCAYCHSTAMA